MKKNILFKSEARAKILKGVNVIADAVCVTLGPSGRNVLISQSVMADYDVHALPVRVTKDGVTVCRAIKLDDALENVGVLLLRDASEKTMSQAGDGTTTTIVLARAMVNKGIELVDAGENPMELKKGIDKSVQKIVDELQKMAIPVGGDIERIRQVATISANNDSSIGDLVAEAFEKIGVDGVIDIEESKSVNTKVILSDGFKFNNGMIHPMFVTNPAKNECELIEPYILIYDKSISTMKQIYPILNQVAPEGKPIIILAEDVDGEALAFLAVNKAQGKLQSCVIKTPRFQEQKRELMEDFAAATGATYISDLRGIGIENVKLEHLGKAKKAIVTKDDTAIVAGEKDKKVFQELHDNLRMNAASAKSEGEKEQIEGRIARLTGSIAVISVGAPTEVEMKERKDRVDDSIRATKSAIAEGFIMGGGTAFLRVLSKFTSGEYNKHKAANDVLFSVLQEPIKQICGNAGVDSAKIIAELNEMDKEVGYNAKTGVIENLVEAGVIDPVKVLRCSLQNAASVATMILTSECIIVDTLN